MCVTVQCCRAKGIYESSNIGDFPGGFDLGFPVVIVRYALLRAITRNTFFHLRRSITRDYAFITFTKESLVSRN